MTPMIHALIASRRKTSMVAATTAPITRSPPHRSPPQSKKPFNSQRHLFNCPTHQNRVEPQPDHQKPTAQHWQPQRVFASHIWQCTRKMIFKPPNRLLGDMPICPPVHQCTSDEVFAKIDHCINIVSKPNRNRRISKKNTTKPINATGRFWDTNCGVFCNTAKNQPTA